MAKYYYSPAKQKILALLASGAVLMFSRSPRTALNIIKNLPKVWRDIEQKTLRRILNEFKNDRLVDFKVEKDGFVSLVLTERGRYFALRYQPDQMKISIPLRWDGRWRFVIFDIPEKNKPAREALRKYLANFGFYQIQKSVWVFPYECKNEIDFLVELFEIRQHVYYLVVVSMTNEAIVKRHFKLI